jgi:hypothetical protein
MPRLLLLATTTGYQTRAFEDAAAHLGIDLVYATDRCHVLADPWRDGAIPIRFHEEDASVAQILDAVRARPIDGIVTVGDRPTVIAARVAEVLGCPDIRQKRHRSRATSSACANAWAAADCWRRTSRCFRSRVCRMSSPNRQPIHVC